MCFKRNYLPRVIVHRIINEVDQRGPLPSPHHNTQRSRTHFSCLALGVTPGLLNYKNLISPNKPNVLLHTNSTVGLLAMSQLRQLVLCNVKCSPIHTLAEILKNTSIKNSDLYSHCQSQLLSAKQHCMCSCYNFINNLGKQRILQQIAVAF